MKLEQQLLERKAPFSVTKLTNASKESSSARKRETPALSAGPLKLGKVKV